MEKGENYFSPFFFDLYFSKLPIDSKKNESLYLLKINEMKKALILASAIALIGITSSCQKCATCTINDPERGTISNEVCSSGNAYESAIKVHEDNGWSCAN